MPKFSVIIPAYNHAHFLGDAVRSVLNQTCQDFEIIVVDDASSDNTHQVIDKISDSRLSYIVHEKNLGLSATRNTGIKAANGDFIAFLDADDWFHPQKLEYHLDYLEKNPKVGVAYNARYDLDYSSMTIRGIWRPPEKVGLSDFVIGFPFAPSDIILRREWPHKVGMLSEDFKFYGEDLYFNCQLALSGCCFGRVDRVLNYRRYHSGRQVKNISETLGIMLNVLNRIFYDPRCPPDVLALKDTASAHYYLWYGIFALVQDETPLGQKYLREAVRLRPSLLIGEHCDLLETLINYSIVDESVDHRLLLKEILDKLPSECSKLLVQYEWGVTRGYLLKGIRAVMWGRDADGYTYFNEAAVRGAEIDQSILMALTSRLLDYDSEFGNGATQDFLEKIAPYIQKTGNKTNLRWLRGNFWVNRAIMNYSSSRYSKALADVLRAIYFDFNYLINRGVIKIFLSSALNSIRQPIIRHRDRL